MSRLQQVQEALPRIKARMLKADAFDDMVPKLLSCSVQLAGGDASKGRQVASVAAPIAAVAGAKPWASGMYTEPGDLVRDPSGSYAYIYTGKDPMTHTNYTFFPGAAGVYHWAIVPAMHSGYRVFPDVAGIVVFVKKDELWWNPSKTKLYVWTSANYDCPSNYYPGAAGVHQWSEAK